MHYKLTATAIVRSPEDAYIVASRAAALLGAAGLTLRDTPTINSGLKITDKDAPDCEAIIEVIGGDVT